MPMFDDPKKELQWLQEQLLAQEEESAPEEAFPESDFDEELDDIIRLISDEKKPPQVSRETAYRNFANNYGQEPEEEESAALYCDDTNDVPQPKKKEKGIGGLVFLAVLETLGILAIAAWWVKFLWL